MVEDKKSPGTGRGKPTLVAVILATAFVGSATMMLWSGWQLYRGETMPPALTGTGTACAWVLLVDEPARAAEAWSVLQTRDLPPETTATLAALTPLWQASAKAGVDRTQAWTLCGLPGGAVLTMPAGPRQAEAAQVLVAQLAVAAGESVAALPWRHGAGAWQHQTNVDLWQSDASPQNAAAIEKSGTIVRVAWSQAGTDPLDLLKRATPSAGTTAKPGSTSLATDQAFRAASERVGAGQVHLFLPAATARQWLGTLTSMKWWQNGIDQAQWLGVMLRLDDDRLRVHGHIGGDESGGAWLKEAFDVQTLDDAAGWIAGDARAAAIVRLPAKTRQQLSPWYGPPSQLFAALLTTPVADLPDNELIWQQFADGKEVAMWRGTTKGPSGWQRAQASGWTLVGSDVAAIARVKAVLAGQAPTVADQADRDRRRLLTHTQGWFRGPLQVDWVWTDTGLAAEAAWLR